MADWLIDSCLTDSFVAGLSDLLVPLFPTALSKGQREVTIPAGVPQYCFQDLSPDALYTATVFLQTPYLEGPGVDAKERTCESPGPGSGPGPGPGPFMELDLNQFLFLVLDLESRPAI